MDERKFIIFLIFLSLCGSLFFILFKHPIESDAEQYYMIGRNLNNGDGYSRSATAIHTPTMDRAPLYPFFLMSMFRLFGEKIILVKLFQTVFFLLTAMLTYLTCNLIFEKKISRIAALSVAICPTLANYPSYILTESLFTFLVALIIFMLYKCVGQKGLKLYFLTGVVLGFSALCKAVMLYFIFFICLGFFLVDGISKETFKKCLVLFFGFLLIVTPWIARNRIVFNDLNIATAKGKSLWVSSRKVLYSNRKILKLAVFTLSEFLGKRVYPEELERQTPFLLQENIRAEERMRKLSSLGFNGAEVDRYLTKEAYQLIWSHPIKFTFGCFIEFLKLLPFLYIPTLNEGYVIDWFKSIKNGPMMISLIRGTFRLLSYFVFLLALTGMLYRRKDFRRLSFLILLIIYFNLSYSILFGSARYNVPLIPFYFMFAVAGVNFIKNKLKAYKSFALRN